jgi:hypothetical protein
MMRVWAPAKHGHERSKNKQYGWLRRKQAKLSSKMAKARSLIDIPNKTGIYSAESRIKAEAKRIKTCKEYEIGWFKPGQAKEWSVEANEKQRMDKTGACYNEDLRKQAQKLAHTPKANEKRKQTIADAPRWWITNGKKNILTLKSKPIPSGYWHGRTFIWSTKPKSLISSTSG